MVAKGYTLEEFIHDMTAKMEQEPDEMKVLDYGSTLLERLVRNPECIPPQYRVPSGKGRTPGHGSYLLYRSPEGLFIQSAVYGPGDYVAPHDHHTWGMIGVLENVLYETRYRRLDDGARPDYAQLEKDRDALTKAGEVSLLIPGGDNIHDIYHHDDRPSVELHVYGKNMEKLPRCLFNVETGKTIQRMAASGRYDNEYSAPATSSAASG